ncbi:MAG: hypothetical protein JRG86_21380 [Deltaproteobacteria bacterium]|jgi:hypothetical protein|nr:hypothetical protein [Deltaproteobacteria bacterium]MBW2495686.1 hypothetical protein [Deltaproteobacteria bacterium]
MAVLKAGTRLKSAVCSSEFMIVVAPAGDVTLTCGGVPVIELAADAPAGATIDPEHKQGTQMGKRYTNEAGDIEILCTKPGEGGLAVDGTALEIKAAKPLPSSD